MLPLVELGYRNVAEFLAFLAKAGGDAAVQASTAVAEETTGTLTSGGFSAVCVAAALGGLALNFTPCVLPLVPVNLIIIGKGFRRGLAYASGIAVAYGLLGFAAAFCGVPFGALVGRPWFNFSVAAIFAFLALALSGLISLDFSRFAPTRFKGRMRAAAGGAGGFKVYVGLVALGALSAVLAGACVAPVALAVLMETATRTAAGEYLAVLLPFVLGLGMALPYPFLAAGFAHLPHPGAWMKRVNLLFALTLAFFACKYAYRGYNAVTHAQPVAVVQTSTAPAPDAHVAKPRLYIIGAPWCVYCTKMHATTLKDPAVQTALARFDVRNVQIQTFEDLGRYPELRGVTDRIRGLPAYVIIP